MKNTNRYSVSADEDFEPNSNNEVLKNYLGIQSRKEIEALEEQELERTELELIELFDEEHQFTAEDICNIHELWLGDIYPSAGKYRTVNLKKDNFLFAAASQIPPLMAKFEKNFLSKYTPCHYTHLDDLAYALGIVHVELILIHPFREGNGRTARLLVDLMSLQANMPSLNYSLIDQTKSHDGFERYIQAIHSGLAENYEPTQRVFKKLLEQSIN